MINCLRCNKPFGNEVELYNHLRDVHRFSQNDAKKLSGWFETKKQTPEGELKALEHQIVQLKSQKQKEMSETLTAPLVLPPPPKAEMKIPAGWQKGQDSSFNFERRLGDYHATNSLITEIITGKITQNHFEMVVWRYEKDLSVIADLKEKEAALSSRLATMVVDDNAFSSVSEELKRVRRQIRELNYNVKPERSNETVLEDYYYQEFGTPEQEAWQSECMKKGAEEADRHSNNFKNESGSDEK